MQLTTTMQVAGVAGVLLVQLFLAWRLIVTTRALDRFQARMAHQGEALSLLTDTSENGFSAIARELDRLATPETKPARRPSTRRVATAARKGRTVADIAAEERVSEGEVRLRLGLAGQLPADAFASR
ncbi:MAG: hypothetical protein ABIX28_06920 [Vicinamibacterales bacterium]